MYCCTCKLDNKTTRYIFVIKSVEWMAKMYIQNKNLDTVTVTYSYSIKIFILCKFVCVYYCSILGEKVLWNEIYIMNSLKAYRLSELIFFVYIKSCQYSMYYNNKMFWTRSQVWKICYNVVISEKNLNVCW